MDPKSNATEIAFVPRDSPKLHREPDPHNPRPSLPGLITEFITEFHWCKTREADFEQSTLHDCNHENRVNKIRAMMATMT